MSILKNWETLVSSGRKEFNLLKFIREKNLGKKEITQVVLFLMKKDQVTQG